MLMMSRVCAEFHDAKGVPIFTVTPTRRNTFVMAPEEIREDPLFQMLVNDGALTADVTPAERRNLENDPMAGVTAEGKKLPKTKAPKADKGAKTAEAAEALASDAAADAAADPDSGASA